MSETPSPKLPDPILPNEDGTDKFIYTSQELQAAQALGAIIRGDIECGESGFYDTNIGDLQISVDPGDPTQPYIAFTYATGTPREVEFGFSLTVPDKGPIIVKNNLRRARMRGQGYGTGAFLSLEHTFMTFSKSLRRPIEIQVFEIDNQPRVVNWYERMGYTPHSTDNPESRMLSKVIGT